MVELTIAAAAASLGVSVDTVRRRIRAGSLTARQDGQGRLLVDVPDAEQMPGAAEQAAEAARQAEQQRDQERVQAELERVRSVLLEVERQRDQLLDQVRAQRERAERDDAERHELRVLLGAAQQQLALMLPAAQQVNNSAQQDAEQHEWEQRPAEAPEDRDAVQSGRPWWRRWFGL